MRKLIMIPILLISANLHADIVDDYELKDGLAEGLFSAIKIFEREAEEKDYGLLKRRMQFTINGLSALSPSYTSARVEIDPDKNGGCGRLEASEAEYLKKIKDLESQEGFFSFGKMDNLDFTGLHFMRSIIAQKKLERKFCHDPKGLDAFFENKVIPTFNEKYGTSLTFDRVAGNTEWISVGIKREDIPKWKEKGFTYNTAGEWVRNVSDDVDEVIAWENIHFGSPSEIAYMIKEGFTTPEAMSAWKSVEEYKECKSLGYTDSAEVSRWRALNVPCREIDSMKAASGHDMGTRWIQAGFTNAQNIQAWRSAGFETPEEALGWIKNGADTLEKVRAAMPGVALRTTFIVGYPTEGESEFQTLLDFVREIRFDRLGAFQFSYEEGTPSAELGDPVPPEVKQARWEALMELQQGISLELNRRFVGKVMDVLIEGYDEENNFAVGRTYRDAPEVDGLVLVAGSPPVGKIVPVRITQALHYDLVGEYVPE